MIFIDYNWVSPPGGSGRQNCTQTENKQLYLYMGGGGETINKTIEKHSANKTDSKTYKKTFNE